MLLTTTCFGPQVVVNSIALHYLIKRLVVFMTVVHTYLYIVVYTHQGCCTL